MILVIVRCNYPLTWKSVVLDILFNKVLIMRIKLNETLGYKLPSSPILSRITFSTYLRSEIPTHSSTLSSRVMRTLLFIAELRSAWKSTVSSEQRSWVASCIIIFLKANSMLAYSCSFNAFFYNYGTFNSNNFANSSFYLLALYYCSSELISRMFATSYYKL